MKLRAETLRDLGACMSPFNAFLFLQGLETLSLRMERHVENAAAVAQLPRVARARVERHLLRACRRAATGRSSTSTCRAAPARCSRSTAAAAATAGQDFIRGVTLWSHLANVGDSKSLIIHPASTTHRQLERRGARGGGRRPGHDPAVGRHRGRRRSDLGPRAGLRARARARPPRRRRDDRAIRSRAAIRIR